jgi:alginate O-acetyltransferase complex protein AlgI
MNLLVTMFISGLWHGAGLNFIVWGLLHGLMLAAHRWWRHRPGAVPSRAFFARAFSWGLTFVAVNLAWAFFCMDIRTALFFLRRLFVG